MQSNHLKVLSALSLAASDTREDTLISIIIRTLFINSNIEKKEIISKIKQEFDFEPYKDEIAPLLDKLKAENRIVISKNIISLSDQDTESVKKQETSLNSDDKVRFHNFKTFITDNLEKELQIIKIKFLWNVFLEYLYDSFYEFGFDAIKTLHPHIKTKKGDDDKFEGVLQKALNKIKIYDKSLSEVFKELIHKFPDFASEEDIEFINSLAQKTLSFSSLGLEPGLASRTINHNIIDWVLYLDTNVLYSLLGLHSHPENQATIALIKLIQTNQEYINIKLRYSELTQKELGKKKVDFSLLDDKMTDSAIRALLKSNKLDGFSTKFYEDLLNNRDQTIHPTKVIELSQRTLKSDSIDIGRNKKRLESIGEDYIESQMNDYINFINNKNDIKRQFCKDKHIQFNPTYRSENQVRHDIALREIIFSSRKLKEGDDLSLNNIKFFAVTLDSLLISYDKSKVSNYNNEKSFPIFFKPSFLLNKLIKILPIKTTDYKKAFIKAITTKGFYRNNGKTEDILKIVNYLKSKGIDNEQVIFDLISEDIFLEKYKELSHNNDFNEGEFIDSKLNIEFKKREEELEAAKLDLQSSKNNISEIEIDKKELSAKKDELELVVDQYSKALKHVNRKVKALEKPRINTRQIDLNFEAGEEREKTKKAEEKAMKLKKSLKNNILTQIEDIRDQNLSGWQRKVWWNLFWVIPLIIISILLLLFPNEFTCIKNINKTGETNETLSLILGIIGIVINFFFLALIRMRYFDERNKKARKENTKIPANLLEKLEELGQL